MTEGGPYRSRGREPSRRHAADARATPVCSRVRRGPPIQKVDLTKDAEKVAFSQNSQKQERQYRVKDYLR